MWEPWWWCQVISSHSRCLIPWYLWRLGWPHTCSVLCALQPHKKKVLTYSANIRCRQTSNKSRLFSLLYIKPPNLDHYLMFGRVVGWQEPTDYYIYTLRSGLSRFNTVFGFITDTCNTTCLHLWLLAGTANCLFQLAVVNQHEDHRFKGQEPIYWDISKVVTGQSEDDSSFSFKWYVGSSQLWTTFTVNLKWCSWLFWAHGSPISSEHAPFRYSFLDYKPCHIPALIYVGVCIRLVFDEDPFTSYYVGLGHHHQHNWTLSIPGSRCSAIECLKIFAMRACKW